VPSEQLMSDMGKLIEELTRTGRLISTAGSGSSLRRLWVASCHRHKAVVGPTADV
jgi:hypothetical protein